MENIQEAKTHLSRLVERVAAGEEIIIAKAGKPMAKLIPYSPSRQVRSGGLLAGKIHDTADCWESDGGLDEAMTGGAIFPADNFSMVAEEASPYRA